jgi:hypothetical protein
MRNLVGQQKALLKTARTLHKIVAAGTLLILWGCETWKAARQELLRRIRTDTSLQNKEEEEVVSAAFRGLANGTCIIKKQTAK